ncbi:hypothetical protein BX616_002658, partial [Lobosporangium transversale]
MQPYIKPPKSPDFNATTTENEDDPYVCPSISQIPRYKSVRLCSHIDMMNGTSKATTITRGTTTTTRSPTTTSRQLSWRVDEAHNPFFVPALSYKNKDDAAKKINGDPQGRNIDDQGFANIE